jgi:dihydrofolate reductase
MNLIVAVDNNWAIGSKNELLIRIPNDHKHFREETTGKVVVLGRKTLETFPQGMPLKNRINIILSKDPNYQVKDAIVVHSIEELLEELKKRISISSAERVFTARCCLTVTWPM